MKHRDLWILALVVVGAYLYGSKAGQAAGASAAYNSIYGIGSPDPSNPGGYVTPNVQSYCTANPSDPLCTNTTYYGASVPGYDVCGTVAGQVC